MEVLLVSILQSLRLPVQLKGAHRLMAILQRLFFVERRCTRIPYWVTIGMLMIANILVSQVMRTISWPDALVVGIGWIFVSSYIWLVVCAARFRDVREPGGFSFMTLTPLVGWGIAIMLGFAATRDGAIDSDDSTMIKTAKCVIVTVWTVAVLGLGILVAIILWAMVTFMAGTIVDMMR